jgi:hypothetical protein
MPNPPPMTEAVALCRRSAPLPAHLPRGPPVKENQPTPCPLRSLDLSSSFSPPHLPITDGFNSLHRPSSPIHSPPFRALYQAPTPSLHSTAPYPFPLSSPHRLSVILSREHRPPVDTIAAQSTLPPHYLLSPAMRIHVSPSCSPSHHVKVYVRNHPRAQAPASSPLTPTKVRGRPSHS